MSSFKTHASVMFELSGEFNGHFNSITSIAVAKHQPSTVFTASSDGTSVVWNLSQTEQLYNNGVSGDALHTIIEPRIIKTLRCHDQSISSVAISVDGTLAITASDDKTLKLWNLNTLMLHQFFAGHQKEVSTVSLSPDASCVVSGSCDSMVLVWNTNGQPIYRLSMEHNRIVSNVEISANGEFLIISSINLIKIYKISQYSSLFLKQIRVIKYSGNVLKLSLSPNSKLLAVGIASEQGNTIDIYEMEQGELMSTFKVQKVINDVCFSEDKYWLCAAICGNIYIWDLSTKAQICNISVCDLKHDLIANCIAFPIGNSVFVGCNDGILRTWSIINSDRYCNYDWNYKESDDMKNSEINDELKYVMDINKTMEYDLKVEREKNEKLCQRINEMEMQIQLFRANEQKWKSKLNKYNALLVENPKVNEELNESKNKYKKLSSEYKKLATKHRNIIHMIHYKLWDFDNVIDWICTLDEGRYQKYVHILHKTMKKEQIKGISLMKLDMNDLHRLGIVDYEDKTAVMQHIQTLANPKNGKRQKNVRRKFLLKNQEIEISVDK